MFNNIINRSLTGKYVILLFNLALNFEWILCNASIQDYDLKEYSHLWTFIRNY